MKLQASEGVAPARERRHGSGRVPRRPRAAQVLAVGGLAQLGDVRPQLARSIQPRRQAISSRQAIFRPWRCSITWTNWAASSRESCVPVSSQAVPRPRISTWSRPASRYSRFRSVISSSPRARGLQSRAREVAPPRVVEIEPRDGIVRLRLGGLLLEREHAAVRGELHDAVGGRDRRHGSRRWWRPSARAAARSATSDRSWP